jgi:uncharacterized protein (TIGR02145 family)
VKNQKTTLAIILLLAVVLTISSFDSKDSSVTIGNLDYIQIGNQKWLTNNLDVSTFRNGVPIPEAKTATEWENAGKERKPAWCYYDNDPKNGEKYGKLYNWYAVNDRRGLAPKGWHIPTDAEWIQLVVFLGIVEAGTKMKSKEDWKSYEGKNGNGTNESGFLGFPGGIRHFGGTFHAIGEFGNWWSSTDGSAGDPFGGTNNAWSRILGNDIGYLDRGYSRNGYGLSVRCLVD